MWCDVICAWAQGADVQYRVQYDSGNWSPWMNTPRNVQFVEYLNYEYRVAPVRECRWQREREAWLAGRRVLFRRAKEKTGQAWDDAWRTVDSWVEAYCRENRDGKNTPLFERDWLEFKIA